MKNDKNAKAAEVLAKLVQCPSDEDERWTYDFSIIRSNADCFDEEVIATLINEGDRFRSADAVEEVRKKGGGQNSQHIALELAERSYEIAQRAANVRQFHDLEGMAASKMAAVAEERGRIIRSADGYEIARRASKLAGDDTNYMIATFNQARAFMQYPGLDHQAIPLLEEALKLGLSSRRDEMVSRSCNFLIHLYNKRGEQAQVERIRATLRDWTTRTD